MRRFIAYLSLAIASLATIGATFNSVFVKTHSNIEYSDGRELVFRLSPEEGEELDDGASDEIAKTMEERLKTYGETRYDIVTEGNDTIKVVLSEDQEQYYSEIKDYLSFNGAFALGTKSNVVAIGDEFLDTTKDCYVTFLNYYPTVVIPIDKDSEKFKAVMEEAKKLQEEADKNATTDESTGETTKETIYVYLAYNFVEGEDTMSSLVEGSDDFDQEKHDKKFMLQFDISNIYLDEQETAIATSVNIDADGDGNVTIDDVGKGTHTANFTVNLLNSDPLPYNVEFIYEDFVPAYFENLINLSNRETVAWSRTLIATIFAILVLFIIAFMFYRYASISITAISISSVYLALIFALLFSVEFNTAAIIGMCAVALASIASGIVYLTKVKEECYRGRTLKKANSEGAKRSLLPIVDINVVLIIIGACVYWLGGPMMVSFAAISVFGGIVSLILNTLGLKGMMWLLTNTTKFAGKYEVIGVENKKVPNILNEEKQEYFGPFQNFDSTKHKKVFGIAAIVLFVASLAGSITFGVLNDGNIFNSAGTKQENTYLYVETTNAKSTVDQAYVEGFFANTSVLLNYDEVLKNPDAERVYEPFDYQSIKTYEKTETVDEVEITTRYIVLTFAGGYTGEEYIVAFDGEDLATASIIKEGVLSEIFSDYLSEEAVDIKASASFKIGTRVNEQQPNYLWVIISVTTGAAFAMLYLVLRYGISKGLTSIFTAGFTGVIVAGIFSLTRITFGLDLFVGLPIIILFALIISIIYMNKEKELVHEDLAKTKDNSIEHRYELVKKSNSLALGPIIAFAVMAIYMVINFAGFATVGTAHLFFFIFAGVVVSIILVTTLYAPVSFLIYKLIKKMNIKKPTIKKRKKKKVAKVKSAEPEEAIFIGIND